MGDKDSMDLESDLVPSMCPPKAAAIDGDRDPAAGNDKMDQENDDTVAVDGRIKIETPVGIPVRGVANNNVEEDIRVVHPGVELDGEGDVDGDDVDDGDDEEPLSCPSHIELGTHSYLTETSFVWKIRHFSSIEDSIIHSPLYFDMDGNHWRINLYPRGNNQKGNISIYGQLCRDLEGKDWILNTTMTFEVLHATVPGKVISKETFKRFYGSDSGRDWGFQQFHSIDDIRRQGFISDDDSLFVRMRVRINVDERDYRAKFDCVGLRNQGATCYMNSLLQALFHLGAFRLAVYQIPTEDEAAETLSIPLALQKLFYTMQVSHSAASTKELTTSFGWTTRDAFVQHDVQELSRVLSDALEQKAKGTPSEGFIDDLFQGQMYNYIRCVNVNYESSRSESFLDVSLNVKDFKNLDSSLEEYCRAEELNGDNQYDAGEEFGKQDARKGTFFFSLPKVLQFHLKRFVYDWQVDMMRKVNDHFEYPEVVDMKPYMHSDAPAAPAGYRYRLFCVLVHMGDVHAGHYYAYVFSRAQNRWYQFDDTRVEIALPSAVFEANFGGLPGGRGFTGGGGSSAYMLMYVREGDIENTLPALTAADIPAHLVERAKAEVTDREERKRESNDSVRINVLTTDTMAEHSGIGVAPASRYTFATTIPRSMTWKALKRVVEEHTKISPRRQRFWIVPPSANYYAGNNFSTVHFIQPQREDMAIRELAVDYYKVPVQVLLICVEVAPTDPPITVADLEFTERTLIRYADRSAVIGAGMVPVSTVESPPDALRPPNGDSEDVRRVEDENNNRLGDARSIQNTSDGTGAGLGSGAGAGSGVGAMESSENQFTGRFPDFLNNEVMLFVKLYDASKMSFSVVGLLAIALTEPFMTYLPALKALCLRSALGTNGEAARIVKEEHRVLLQLEESYRGLGSIIDISLPLSQYLRNGTIVVVQFEPVAPSSYAQPLQCPRAADYVRFLENQSVVVLRHVRDLMTDVCRFNVDLSWEASRVVEAAAIELRKLPQYAGLDADYVRLLNSNGPNTLGLLTLYRDKFTRIDPYYRDGGQVYLGFEVLPYPLSKMVGMSELCIEWIDRRAKERTHDVHLLVRSDGATYGDVLQQLRDLARETAHRIAMGAPAADPSRVVEMASLDGDIRLSLVHSHAYETMQVDPRELVSALNSRRIICAEEVFGDDSVVAGSRLVQLVHYSFSDSAFGLPEPFSVRPGEKFAAAKERIRCQLEVGEEEFKRWRISLRVSPTAMTAVVVEDDADLADEMARMRADTIALQHRDPKKREKNSSVAISIRKN